MAERPDDIPAAVREAFANSRVAGAWEMLARSDGSDRLAALRGVERLLEKRGLGLFDILEAVLKIPAPKSPSTSFDAAFSGFGDVFADMARKQRESRERGSEPRPAARRARTTRQGAEIPATVVGTPEIIDRRTTRNGLMLVFMLKTDLDAYGPITSFSDSHIEKIDEAAAALRMVGAKITQPSNPRYTPSTSSVWYA